MNHRYWLLLEKSDETRISKGIDGYMDRTGESYHYDSLVPNHKQLTSGDPVVIRKEDDILGVGRVSAITEEVATKFHRRCPKCGSTDIRERIKKLPTWKCGKCPTEFSEPEETSTEVQSYVATIAGFSRLASAPTVAAVKSCSTAENGPRSMLSILELDPQKIQTLLEGVYPVSSFTASSHKERGQGFGLSASERKQVELQAMHLARHVYEKNGWKVVDRSGSHPYDFYATRGGDERFIEVKGTTGTGESIALTYGEVDHANLYKDKSALVVVSKIVLTESRGVWTADGGVVSTHEDPWQIDQTRLQATQYRYGVK